MMKYMGLDPATTTGWSYFEDDELKERGSIQLVSQMDLPQKLHYFHLELQRLISRLSPDWCFIEDVFLGISGAKTLAYLARLNGIAINACFSIMQERVKLYMPDYWKAHSFPNINGQAKKWQIQLAAVRYFSLPITGNFSSIDQKVMSFEEKITIHKQSISDDRNALVKLKTKLLLKRNPPTEGEKREIIEQIKILNQSLLKKKKDLKIFQDQFDKQMSKTSIDIAAQTGMTDNICDSCGIAICGYNEVKNA
jgi:Holliday junction resolvasome RuvABC endonuclease subunit